MHLLLRFCGVGGFTGSFLREVLTYPYLIYYLLLIIRLYVVHWRIYRFFLKGGLTSPYLIFDLLLILGLYVVHWIDISLRFSKSPNLLKSESGRKSYYRFCLPSFLVGANPVCTGIFTGRPVSGRRDRAVHRVASFGPA
jgi:hypothetical protein